MSNKVIKRVLLIFTFVFVASQLLTSTFASPSDGKDYVGWPFRYYEYLGEKFLEGGSGYSVHFLFMPFLLDAGLILLGCRLVVWLTAKFISSRH